MLAFIPFRNCYVPATCHVPTLYWHSIVGGRGSAGAGSVYLSWAKSLGAAHWDAQWARWKTVGGLDMVVIVTGGLTYILQRSPRWPCRRSRSGLLPVGRTRRSGAWGRGIPWTRRILGGMLVTVPSAVALCVWPRALSDTVGFLSTCPTEAEASQTRN